MGMAVKGEGEHRLVRAALLALKQFVANDPNEDARRDAYVRIDRLLRRADLGIERSKKRKRARDLRAQGGQ